MADQQPAALEKAQAAAVLQKISRGFLAKRQFAKDVEAQKTLDEKAGIVAPFVPTPLTAIRTFRDKLLLPGDVLCDLGCGDGRVLIECAQKIKKGMGVDIQELPLSRARENSLHFADKVCWVQGDFRDSQVEQFLSNEATVCFLFLLPEVVESLLSYLVRTLRPASRIVCYTFALPQHPASGFAEEFTWIPSRQIEIPDLPSGMSILYEYIVDERVKAGLIENR